jgi:hypothetical protein
MTLGRYKLREKLGEGGCGTVYVAEQTEPVRRRVALKVIKLGMDTKQVVARFEAEMSGLDVSNVRKETSVQVRALHCHRRVKRVRKGDSPSRPQSPQDDRLSVC